MRRRALLLAFPVSLLCLLGLLGSTAPAVHCRVPVTVTAYSHTGHPTASGVMPRPGMLALSPDLERDLALRFGAPVRLEGLGTYTFTDRMPPRWYRRVDLFHPSDQAAWQFGKRQSAIVGATACETADASPRPARLLQAAWWDTLKQYRIFSRM
jgi:3D (Asp-Asp-Asp) domain-containing protein